MDTISICDTFDSGNIKLIEIINNNEVIVHIKDEPFTIGEMKQHKQWFHFKASGVKGKECKFVISNANKCSFPAAWENYNVCTSYDRQNWFRTNTKYNKDTGALHWTITSEANQVYFAYFAPYSLDRHNDLIAHCSKLSITNPYVQVHSIGHTLDQRDMDMIIIGNTAIPGHKKIWAIARQHPGESMAEWWMEGYIYRLLNSNDPIVREVLKRAVFYIIPNMNPDGSIRGHLRTNAGNVYIQ